jgi:hypothetical protein
MQAAVKTNVVANLLVVVKTSVVVTRVAASRLAVTLVVANLIVVAKTSVAATPVAARRSAVVVF